MNESTSAAEKIGTDLTATEENDSRDSAVHSETPGPAESGENIRDPEKIAEKIAEKIQGSFEIAEDKLTRRPPKLEDLEPFLENVRQPSIPAITGQTPPNDSPPAKKSGTMEPEPK